MKINKIVMFAFIVSSITVFASENLVTEVKDNKGESLGQVNFSDSKYGLLIAPNLHNLPAGVHGFHIHVNHDCSKAGMAAGGHLDPQHANTHLGPYANGHLGDMPALVVSAEGIANILTLAPRLTTAMIKGHTLMIHGGGDNYTDSPENGGGGPRIGCGLI